MMKYPLYLPLLALLPSLFNPVKLSANHYEVLGVGSPIVDVIYCVDDEFLKATALNKGDGHSTTDWEVYANILDQCAARKYQSKLATGGSSSNTIKGLASLNNTTAFLGKIGSDSLGSFYTASISQLHIKLLLPPAPIPSSQVAVFVTQDHQRTFFSYSGAGLLLPEEKLQASMFKNVRVVHFEGYLFDELSFSYVEEVMRLAKSEGAIITLDIGCARIAKKYAAEIPGLLKDYVDIIFANESEVKALLELPPNEACIALSQLCRIAVVLIGKEGCLVGTEEGYIHSPGIKVDAIDTTGAGDLFASGFIHGYLKGYDLSDCAWIGNLLGSTVVTTLGAEIPADKWPLLIGQIDAHFNNTH